jgi:hypothetical protein
MAPVHVFSVKLGTSHGLWQYKTRGTHDRVVLHGFRHVLNATCQLLGFDHADRSVIYLFRFSSEPFEDYQVCLQKIRETSAGGCHYQVAHSRIGGFRAEGLLPAFVRTDYLVTWPQRIYYSLERSLTGGIVN